MEYRSAPVLRTWTGASSSKAEKEMTTDSGGSEVTVTVASLSQLPPRSLMKGEHVDEQH